MVRDGFAPSGNLLVVCGVGITLTFVEEGDDVTEGDVVGLVGVMKNFYDVTVPADGTITEILAENEQEVDAGDELFILEDD